MECWVVLCGADWIHRDSLFLNMRLIIYGKLLFLAREARADNQLVIGQDTRLELDRWWRNSYLVKSRRRYSILIAVDARKGRYFRNNRNFIEWTGVLSFFSVILGQMRGSVEVARHDLNTSYVSARPGRCWPLASDIFPEHCPSGNISTFQRLSATQILTQVLHTEIQSKQRTHGLSIGRFCHTSLSYCVLPLDVITSHSSAIIGNWKLKIAWRGCLALTLILSKSLTVHATLGFWSRPSCARPLRWNTNLAYEQAKFLPACQSKPWMKEAGPWSVNCLNRLSLR
jgi:hypothetical protein